jgi:hypothetical protein
MFHIGTVCSCSEKAKENHLSETPKAEACIIVVHLLLSLTLTLHLSVTNKWCFYNLRIYCLSSAITDYSSSLYLCYVTLSFPFKLHNKAILNNPENYPFIAT